jgi:hypothetical protein
MEETMKAMKAVLTIFISLFLFPAVTHAQSNPTPRPVFIDPKISLTPEQRRCMRRVVVRLNDKMYALSRFKTMRYTKPDGTSVTSDMKEHPMNDCNLIDTGPVQFFSTGFKTDLAVNVEAGVHKDTDVSTYKQYKARLDEAFKNKQAEKMPNGMHRITFGEVTFFLLPKLLAKTGNEEPILVHCRPNPVKNDTKNCVTRWSYPKGGGEYESTVECSADIADGTGRLCSSRYLHPEGFFFGYDYKEDKKNDPITMDIVARKKLKELEYTEPQEVPAAAPQPETKKE